MMLENDINVLNNPRLWTLKCSLDSVSSCYGNDFHRSCPEGEAYNNLCSFWKTVFYSYLYDFVQSYIDKEGGSINQQQLNVFQSSEISLW